MSTIVLNSKSYDGVGFNPNQFSVFKNIESGVPSGFSFLTNKVGTGTGDASSSVKWNLSVPVIATEDSSCACDGAVLRTYYARIEVTVPAGSTAAERTDLVTRLQDLLATTQFELSVENLAQAN